MIEWHLHRDGATRLAWVGGEILGSVEPVKSGWIPKDRRERPIRSQPIDLETAEKAVEGLH